MRHKEILPIWVRVEPGVIVIKGYAKFSKAPGHEPRHRMQFIVTTRTLVGRWSVLPLCGGGVGIFYSPS